MVLQLGRSAAIGWVAFALGVLSSLPVAAQAPAAWLDRPMARWNRSGALPVALPGADARDALARRFNLFVFVGGAFAGTLSPVAMTPSQDGAPGAVRIAAADAITAEFARYVAGDAACCPSSRMRVTYRLDRRGARPVLEPVEARRTR